MKQYVKFHQTYGNGILYSKIDIDDIDEYDQYLLFPEILNILKEDGVSSFGNGLIWTLNPADYVDWLNNWLPFEDKSIPFARSAFGDILFVREGNIMVLNSCSAKISLMTDDVDIFINRYLTDKWFLETFFNGDIFNQLEKKLLTPDECFGFKPILAIGGIRSADAIEIYKIHEHLDILSKSAEIRFYEH
jgi:hypothetical protein